jgi:hypothetical protein
MGKFQADRGQLNSWREWLAKHSTAELRAALDPLSGSSIPVGDGGKTLIRQILAEREARGE